MGESRVAEFADAFARSATRIAGACVAETIKKDKHRLINTVGPVLFDLRTMLYERSDAVFGDVRLHDAMRQVLSDAVPLLRLPGAVACIMEQARTGTTKHLIFDSLLALLKIYLLFLIDKRDSHAR